MKHKEPTYQTLKEVSGGRYTYSGSRPATPRILPKLPSGETAIFIRNLALANQDKGPAVNVSVDDQTNSEDRVMDTFVQDTRQLSLTGGSDFEGTEAGSVQGTKEIDQLSDSNVKHDLVGEVKDASLQEGSKEVFNILSETSLVDNGESFFNDDQKTETSLKGDVVNTFSNSTETAVSNNNE